jgi:hypothetical protein
MAVAAGHAGEPAVACAHMADLVVPALGESITEAVVSVWL